MRPTFAGRVKRLHAGFRRDRPLGQEIGAPQRPSSGRAATFGDVVEYDPIAGEAVGRFVLQRFAEIDQGHVMVPAGEAPNARLSHRDKSSGLLECGGFPARRNAQ
jgi:hypothetical protein